MERTNTFIKVWFWPRIDGAIPRDVSKPGDTVDTNNWGTPSANFPNTNCNIGKEFDANNITVDMTLCSLEFALSY
jgi:hypothetical protein